MTVYFIGAGPGAADLLTVRASRIIGQCGTCLYDDTVITADVLATCSTTARLVNTARMPTGEVVTEIRAALARGEDVAQLHPGDPSLYSAVDEQIRALDAEGIGWEIVPGVPAFAAAAAGLGVELTVPHIAQTVILTRVDGRVTSMPSGEDLASVCASGATAVIHLAAAQLPHVVRELTPVYGADCPVAVVSEAHSPDEVTIRGTLADIASRVTDSVISRSAVTIVGRVLDRVGGDHPLRSFLAEDTGQREFINAGVRDVPSRDAPAAIPSGTPVAAPAVASMPPGRILVLGGTSEGRQLADLMVTAGLDVVTSLFDRVSRARLPRGEVRFGGFGGTDGLVNWISENNVSALIDATHPFAEQISDCAGQAANETGIPHLRLHRRPWTPQPDDEWLIVPDMASAARMVSDRFRRPMLTVGNRGLEAFAGDSRGSYLIRCAEPPTGPIPHRYLLVLDRGPFGADAERTLMARHRIDVLVTRNSGGEATEAKLEAARELQIPVIMINRPATPSAETAETVHSVDEAARWLVSRFGSR